MKLKHLIIGSLLCATLRRLVKAGHSIVVVEHSPDLIARADWVIDLGPGGGPEGGRLLYSGPLDPFVESGGGPTAEELRRFLSGWRFDESLEAGEQREGIG